jgi:DNA transposition AAA+ family ATPase
MTSTQTPISTLSESVKLYLTDKNLTVAELSKMVDFSRPALTQYLNGKYSSNPANVERALEEFMRDNAPDYLHQAVPFSSSTQSPTQRTDFLRTRDARGAISICETCQKNGIMGTVTGKSGRGKTFSLEHFARLPRVARIECNVFWGPRDLVKEIEDALGIPVRSGTVRDHMRVITDFFATNKGYLLIVDEADKLISRYAQQKMEVIRGIYDSCKVGIVLAGEPKLQSLLESNLPQTENRAIYGYELQGLSSSEVYEYLSPYTIDPDVREELHGRAYGGRKGCFRLLVGTLSALINEATVSGADTIDMDCYIRATSNMLIR